MVLYPVMAIAQDDEEEVVGAPTMTMPTLAVPTNDHFPPAATVDASSFIPLLRRCRLFLKPYLPPPVVSSMRAIDEHFYDAHDVPEASMFLLFTLLVALGWIRFLRFVTRRMSVGGGGADDEDDLLLAGGGGRRGGGDDGRDLVLLCGAPGGGKTALLHALCRTDGGGDGGGGSAPPVVTVTSMRPLEGTAVPSAGRREEDGRDDDDETATSRVVDFPGHVRLRHDLPRIAARADRIVLVVDATRPVREGADVLYLLLTDRGVRDAWGVSGDDDDEDKMPILCVCAKSDMPGAKNCARIRLQLRTELDRIRRTSSAWQKKQLGGPEGGDKHVNGVGGEGGEGLPLGIPGKALDLDTCEDLPCRLSFVAASCCGALPLKKGGAGGDGNDDSGLVAVREFVLRGPES